MLGMFLPLCVRRGSSSASSIPAVRCFVCVCRGDEGMGWLCFINTEESRKPLWFGFLPLSAAFFPPSSFFYFFPWPRESSDILRVCPAPHSSAASEECLSGPQAAALLHLDVDRLRCSLISHRWLLLFDYFIHV